MITVRGSRDFIRDARAARAARRRYAEEASRLALVARDHRNAGHALLAREAAWWSQIAERAAAAERADPEPGP